MSLSSFLLLTFAFSFAPRANALPHYGDPNQAYDQIPGTYETPHVKWATPLAGGKLKALVILPYGMTREAIELRQRIDLDMTVIMTAARTKRAQGYREGPTATPIVGAEADAVVDKIMKERLVEAKTKYDVIVLGKIGWNVFKPAEKQAIIQRVKDGAGLIWYEPQGDGDDYKALVGEVDEQTRTEVFRGYPSDVFPIAFFKTTAEMKKSYAGRPRNRAVRAPCRVLAKTLGKGRVIAFDFGEENVMSPSVFGTVAANLEPYTGDNRNTDQMNEFDYTFYCYNFALAARAILVATGRDAKALELELPKKIDRVAMAATPLVAKVAMSGRETRDKRRDDRVSSLASQVSDSRLASQVSGSGLSSQVSRPSSLVFEIRPRRAPHGAPAVYTAEEPIRSARVSRAGSEDGRAREDTSTTVSFQLPALPAGTYLASVRLRDEKGAAIDFATTSFEVTSDVSLKIATKSDRYEAGTTIEGTVTPSRALKDGEKIVVKAVDTWGRVVALVDATSSSRQNKDSSTSSVRDGDVASTVSFSIPVVSPLSRLWDLESEICDSQGVVATAKTWVGIPDWTFDDYMTMLIFSAQPSPEMWMGDYHADLMRRKAGVNAVYTGLLYGDPRNMECNERHHLASVAYSAHYGEGSYGDNRQGTFQNPNTNLDTYAATEMINAAVARGCRPIDAKEFPYSQRGLNAGEFNVKMNVFRYVGKFGTPHYCLTMENFLSGEFWGTENSGFGPETTKQFQQWCKKEYKNDLAALNREWNTSFASWDEVTGVMMVDAVLKNQQCRWLDFRYFMRSQVWGGFFLSLDKLIHAIDPHYGYVGMGGHAQHDYTQYRGPHMTSGKLYVSQKDNWEWQDAFECEMRQSFADDEGWWLGSQSNIRWTSDLNNPISRKRLPWAMLFMGLYGFDWENSFSSLGGSLGGMTWTYADHSDVLPFTAEIAEEVFQLERGIGKLAINAKKGRAPVAIDWSPRNHYLSRLLPEQPRGFSGTYLYNISLVDGAPNDVLGLMNSLRMRPKIVAPEDVAGLAKKGYKALWLPYNKGMSDEEATAILDFVKQGGLVLADHEPGLYDQHGKKRSTRVLQELFPDFSRVTVTPFGKGHAAYLAGKTICYPDRMLAGDFAGADIVAGLLEKYAGLKSAVGMTDKDGAEVRNIRYAEFDMEGTRLVGLLRKHTATMPNDEIVYNLDFRGEYDVYDITKKCAYLGRHSKMNLAIDHYAKMLALVPAKIEGAKLAATVAARSSSAPYQAKSGGAVELTLGVTTREVGGDHRAPRSTLTDAYHLEVFGPDGAELECYRKNYIVKGNALKLSLPLALNAAKGTYRAVMTSAISGVKAETTFENRVLMTKRKITIASTDCAFEREPMVRPFGFKGGHLTELWTVSACVRSTTGKYGIGLGTQSCLWSDAKVFSSHSEEEGNALMFALTREALRLLVGRTFTSPIELLDWLWPQVWAYGREITKDPALRATFALNALVAVDNAVWVLYARENGFTSFDELIPDECRPALACRHAACASIPLFSYGVPVSEIKAAAEAGYFFLKIKIGQAGTQEEMLEKDKARLTEIHRAIGDCRTPHTKSGKLLYYLDANGRYEKKETLLKLVDHLRTIGALDQVAILEEPFDEFAEIDVRDIPLRLAADESAHTVKDALTRIEMGYGAMTLKPIAKTLSMSLQIAAAAHAKGVPCFCADLTVCPVLVEWNKCVAARLASFPGLGDVGLVESNGDANYRNWETMRNDLAFPSARWSRMERGVFACDDDYYVKSGGILEPMPRYEAMFGIK